MADPNAAEHRLVIVKRSVDGVEIEYADLVHNERFGAYRAAERLAPGAIVSMKSRRVRIRNRWWERNPQRPTWDDVRDSPVIEAEQGFTEVPIEDG